MVGDYLYYWPVCLKFALLNGVWPSIQVQFGLKKNVKTSKILQPLLWNCAEPSLCV